MKIDAIIISEADNVATALRDLKSGERVTMALNEQRVQKTLSGTIPYGHKFALRKIEKGEDIIKYGEVMGRATKDIHSGMHAHVHNIESLRGRGDLT